MPPNDRRSTVTQQLTLESLLRIGAELRNARLQRGLTQARVGEAAGVARTQVSRIERGLAPELSVAAAMRLFSAVGLDLSIRSYPGGQPVRDAAHLGLVQRLKPLVAPTATWQFERPLPIPRDQRGWDVVLGLIGGLLAVEAETRPRDVQELLRRTLLKLRDDHTISRLLLVVADTRHNRRLLREHCDVIGATFPAPHSQILAALASGVLPEANGVLLV